jgi:transposase
LVVNEKEAVMRTIALDVHRRFAEVAVHEEGALRRLGRIETSPADLRAFAVTLGPDDHVVLEATGNAWAIAELLAGHAGKVTVSNPMRTRAIASAKVKTDKVDAAVLAQLAAADFLPVVWTPDAETRSLRRRVAHRAQLVRQRTRLRNQIHAILARNLVEVPMSDLFGKQGRCFLATLELPEGEREQLESGVRLEEALAGEVARADESLARTALAEPGVRRLMTIPGVGAITALALLAVLGEVERFPSGRHVAGYLGLDPRVRQSGERSAHTGRISRQGQAHARGLLIEAAHAAIRTPGPLRGFYLRVSTRRGTHVALVATARKLAVLCWHLLINNEDYRFQAPSLTERKLRALQTTARDERPKLQVFDERERRRQERTLLEQAERNYRDFVASRAKGAGATKGDATPSRPRRASDARQARSPQAPALLVGVTRANKDGTPRP